MQKYTIILTFNNRGDESTETHCLQAKTTKEALATTLKKYADEDEEEGYWKMEDIALEELDNGVTQVLHEEMTGFIVNTN